MIRHAMTRLMPMARLSRTTSRWKAGNQGASAGKGQRRSGARAGVDGRAKKWAAARSA